MKLGVEIENFDGLLSNIDGLENDLADYDKVLRTGVLDMYAQISERIQQRGEDSDGNKIGGGAYSKGHAAARRKQGRQTNFIDLTLSGLMMDLGFIVGPTPAGGFGLGWANKLAADRMGYLERNYGVKIISPSQAEKDQAFSLILEDIRNVLAQRNKGN